MGMPNKVYRSLSIFLAGFVTWVLLWQVLGAVQALLVGAVVAVVVVLFFRWAAARR